jgi:hypothetical protein
MINRTTIVPVVLAIATMPALSNISVGAALCRAKEQAVPEMDHKTWLAAHNHDPAAFDLLIDSNYMATDDAGAFKRRAEVLAHMGKKDGNIYQSTYETPEDFQFASSGNVVVANFTRHWTDIERNSGETWGATARITMVLVCNGVKWKILAYHETGIPNKSRVSSKEPRNLDDYVGKYRLGDSGEISVSSKDGKLYEEGWGSGPEEIFPGKHDTFFSRDDGWDEMFIRDHSGKVTSILYTHTDGQIEVTRIPQP